jgi:cytochrome c-type biogenesis protein CcmE
MYGRKVKLRFLFVVLILITLILTTFLVLKSLEENVGILSVTIRN